MSSVHAQYIYRASELATGWRSFPVTVTKLLIMAEGKKPCMFYVALAPVRILTGRE